MSDNLPEKKLKPSQRRALESLLGGQNIGEAAAAAGVNPKTVSRWLNDDVTFYETLQRHSRAGVQRAGLRLNGLLDTAVDVFQDVMKNPTQKGASIKLRAANYAVQNATKLLEINDILQRLEALELRLP